MRIRVRVEGWMMDNVSTIFLELSSFRLEPMVLLTNILVKTGS